jgi:hypothetical protein
MTSVRTAVASCVAVAAVLLVPTSPAQAGIEDGACDDREWCLFKDVGLRGCVTDEDYDSAGNSGNLDSDYVSCKGQKVKDSVSSYQNRAPAWMVLFEHPEYKGYTYCVVPGGSGNVLKSFNDKASSIAVLDRELFNAQVGEGKCNHIDRD